MQINHTAVRAFLRIWAPIAERFEMGRAADHAIDAGEWSDAASSDMECAAFNECLDKVAPRFNLTAHDLWQQVMNHEMDESFKFMHALETGHPPHDAATATGMYDHY